MKKLNRKGFTLVELLAVIIILAIVVGITIPAILTTTSNAKKKAFTTAAETCADWIERQYQLYIVDNSDSGLNGNLKDKTKGFKLLTVAGGSQTQLSFAYSSTDANDVITACGLKGSNVGNVKIQVSSAGRVCVLLEAAKNGSAYSGDYAGVGNATGTGSASENTNYAVGGTCGGVTFS